MSALYEEYRAFVSQMMLKDGVQMPIEFIALGLAGETSELMEAVSSGERPDVVKEAGDVLWYIEAMFIALSLDVDRGYYTNGKPIFHNVGAVCDIVKKACWHGKGLDYELVTVHLLSALEGLNRFMFESFDCDMEEIMGTNMAKLKARYPNGFTIGGGIR